MKPTTSTTSPKQDLHKKINQRKKSILNEVTQTHKDKLENMDVFGYMTMVVVKSLISKL